MSMQRFALLTTTCIAAGALGLGLTGCREDMSPDPPVQIQRNMMHQERYNSQSYSEYFDDHRTMRTPVEGTMSQEQWDRARGDEELISGRLADNSGFVMTVPPSAIALSGDYAKALARGQERFNIYCAPCHSRTGDGKGMVARVQNGFAKVTSLHDKTVREMPDGQLYATITNGVRVMPSYAAQIPLADRWAIVAYVRALELSQVSQADPSHVEPKK